ncbi:MAG: hypothetical protein BM556_13345 [Bacteriovorax sp. MedPE-SWde]|nr:MAG: hypothetical protein BM556_13345 [Bacteriovorax sp. MedPE-SWde]
MKIKNNSGFSLAEVMVAAALLGAVSLGVVRLIDNMSKSQKSFETSSELTLINNAIAQTLTNERACEQTFGGVNFGVDTSVNVIRNATGTDIYRVGNNYGNRTVNLLGLDIENVTLNNDGASKSGTFDLVVRMEKASRQAQGIKNISKRITVSVVTNLGDAFVSCFNSAAGATKNTCENIGGTFDMASQNCTLVNYPGIGAIPDTLAGQQEAVSQRYINNLLDELDGRYLVKGVEDLGDAVPANTTTIGNSAAGDSVILNSSLQVNGLAVFNEHVELANGKYLSMQSDKSLKTNIKPLSGVLEKIKKVDGVSFSWKENGSKDIGVIAQSLKKVFPDLVVTDHNSEFLMVKYPQLSAVNLQAVKELSDRNKSLESEVRMLRSALCELHPNLKVCLKR